MSKKLIKKCLAILLVIVMMFTCFTVTGFAWSGQVADENGDYYEVSYEEAEDLTVSFDEATGTLHVYGNGAIPKTDKWVDTKSGVDIDIAGPAMYPEYHDKITKLVIHEGITAIGTGAFSGLINLKEVQLPETLECVGDWAFMACLSLEKVNFSENLKYITPEAAFCLTRLKSIVLPENFEYCDYATFAYCFFVEEVVVPESINTQEFVLIYSPHIKTITNKSDDVICRFGFEYCYPQDDNELAEKLADLYMMRPEFLVDAAIKGTSFDEAGYLEKASELMGMTFSSEEDIWNYTNSFYAEDDSSLYNDYHVYCYENSAQHLFCEENGIPYSFINDNETEEDPIIEDVTVTDENTGVTAEYTSDIFDGTPEMVITEGGKNANIAFNGKFGKYTSYDISFEIDGEKVQPNGKVTIKIPLPEGYNPNSVKVFFIDDNGNKTKLDSTYENGYIIFETDHFSEYAIVDESSEIIDEPATEPDEPTTNPDDTADNNCSCNCHKSGFMGFIWKILCFFYKLFKTNPVCACGIAHY